MASVDLAGKDSLRELKLVTPEIKFLAMLLERGGEIDWDWSSPNLSPNGKAMIANLMNKDLVIDREYVTHANQAHGVLKLRLTDRGQAVARELAKFTIAAKTVEGQS